MSFLSTIPSPSRWLKSVQYTPLQPHAQDVTPVDHSPIGVPTVQQLIASRRVRFAAVALLIIVVLGGVIQLPAGRASNPTWKPGSEVSLDELAPENANIDWTRYAYVQYVTNKLYLCNSVMMFESLHRLKSKADRVMMYPGSFDVKGKPGSDEAKLLIKARDQYNVKLRPIHVQRRNGGESTWGESFTKLLAFNQTDYTRVLGLDSDATILRPMDELFLTPSARLAMPRAYWLKASEHRSYLSSQIILAEPSDFEFKRIVKAIDNASKGEYDMEILNNIYGDSAMILPHRPYNLLTGEFKSKNHVQYLGNDIEQWDGQQVFKEAKFLHFSDWPLPKPWLASAEQVEIAKPSCDNNTSSSAQTDCVSQELWVGFYTDFRRRRDAVCGENYRRR